MNDWTRTRRCVIARLIYQNNYNARSTYLPTLLTSRTNTKLKSKPVPVQD